MWRVPSRALLFLSLMLASCTPSGVPSGEGDAESGPGRPGRSASIAWRPVDPETCLPTDGKSAALDEIQTLLCELLRTERGSLSFEEAVERFGSPTLVDLWSRRIVALWESRDGSLQAGFDVASRRLLDYELMAPVALPLPPVPFCISTPATLIVIGSRLASDLPARCEATLQWTGLFDLEQAEEKYGAARVVVRDALQQDAVVQASWFSGSERWLAFGFAPRDGTMTWFHFRDLSLLGALRADGASTPESPARVPPLVSGASNLNVELRPTGP